MVRTKQHIELHKQFKVPLDGLMAEEISTLTGNKKRTVKEQAASAKTGPYQQVESDKDSESDKDDSSA